MWHCSGCGHYHGSDGVWVKCQAVTYSKTGGVRRCGCTTPGVARDIASD